MPLTTAGIAYDRSELPGSTSRLLFLHAGVADRRMWQPQWIELADRYDLTRLDLRGFGESATMPSGNRFSHAGDVVALMDELGLRDAHLIGSSFGAGVALEVALTDPRRVRSLLLCPPGGSALDTLTDDLNAFIRRERQAMATGDLDAAIEANVDAWLVGRGRTTGELDATLVEQVRVMQRRAFEASEIVTDAEEIEFVPPALERLDEIASPTLVLVGALDMDTVLMSADRLCSGIAGASRLDWPDCAHLPSLEQPRRFADLIERWVPTGRG